MPFRVTLGNSDVPNAAYKSEQKPAESMPIISRLRTHSIRVKAWRCGGRMAGRRKSVHRARTRGDGDLIGQGASEMKSMSARLKRLQGSWCSRQIGLEEIKFGVVAARAIPGRGCAGDAQQ